MIPTGAQIEILRRDFERSTDYTFKNFWCPILYEDRADVELMEGHILPQAVKIASAHTTTKTLSSNNPKDFSFISPMNPLTTMCGIRGSGFVKAKEG